VIRRRATTSSPITWSSPTIGLEAAQLVSREWVITGFRRKRGAGGRAPALCGETPLLQPGASIRVHQFLPAADVDGSMQGGYMMRLTSGETFPGGNRTLHSRWFRALSIEGFRVRRPVQISFLSVFLTLLTVAFAAALVVRVRSYSVRTTTETADSSTTAAPDGTSGSAHAQRTGVRHLFRPMAQTWHGRLSSATRRRHRRPLRFSREQKL